MSNKLIQAIKDAADNKGISDDILLENVMHAVLFEIVQEPYFGGMYDYLFMVETKNSDGVNKILYRNHDMSEFKGQANSRLAYGNNVISDFGEGYEIYEDSVFKGDEKIADITESDVIYYMNPIQKESIDKFEDMLVKSISFYELADKIIEETKTDPEFYIRVEYASLFNQYSDRTSILNLVGKYIKIRDPLNDVHFVNECKKLKTNTYNVGPNSSNMSDLDLRDIYFHELSTLAKDITNGHTQGQKKYLKKIEEENFINQSSFIGSRNKKIKYLLDSFTSTSLKVETLGDLNEIMEGNESLFEDTLYKKYMDVAAKNIKDKDKRKLEVSKATLSVINSDFFKESKNKMLKNLERLSRLGYKEYASSERELIEDIKQEALSKFPILTKKPSINNVKFEKVEREFKKNKNTGQVDTYRDISTWDKKKEKYITIKKDDNPIINLLKGMDTFSILGNNDDIDMMGGEKSFAHLQEEYLNMKWGGDFHFAYDEMGIVGYSMIDKGRAIKESYRDEDGAKAKCDKISYFSVCSNYNEKDFNSQYFDHVVKNTNLDIVYLDLGIHGGDTGICSHAVDNTNGDKFIYASFGGNMRAKSISNESLSLGSVQRIGECIDNGDIKIDQKNIKNLLYKASKLSENDKKELDGYSYDWIDKKYEIIAKLLNTSNKKLIRKKKP
jgi:hypothetical protein